LTQQNPAGINGLSGFPGGIPRGAPSVADEPDTPHRACRAENKPRRIKEKPALDFKGDPEAGRAGKTNAPPALIRRTPKQSRPGRPHRKLCRRLQRRQSNPPRRHKKRRAFWASPTAKEGGCPPL